MTRRTLLGGAAALAAARFRLLAEPPADPARQLEQILARIRPPQFPDRAFEITRFGAREGGRNSILKVASSPEAAHRDDATNLPLKNANKQKTQKI